MGLVLVIFLQTSDGNIQSQSFFDNFTGCIDLTLATINDNQVRRCQAILHHPAVPAIDDLSHTGVIIWPDHCFDFEFAVILLAGLSVHKDHHGRNWASSLNIGVVKSLDANRLGNMEQVAQIFNGPLSLLHILFQQVKLLLEADPGIFGGQINQLFLLALLGLDHLDIH